MSEYRRIERAVRVLVWTMIGCSALTAGANCLVVRELSHSIARLESTKAVLRTIIDDPDWPSSLMTIDDPDWPSS